jgi:hypothetical protein
MSTTSNNLSTAPSSITVDNATPIVAQENNAAVPPASVSLGEETDGPVGLDESTLSTEVLLDSISHVDTEMDDASIAPIEVPRSTTPVVQGIENNLVILQYRIFELSSIIIQQGNSVPSHLVTELRSLRASLAELVEVQRILKPTPVVTQAAPAPFVN